jgi:peroxiredoxin
MRKLLVFISIVLFSVSFVLAQTNGYKPGDNAIDFKLKSTDGKVYSLADLNKGKGFIVIFTNIIITTKPPNLLMICTFNTQGIIR